MRFSQVSCDSSSFHKPMVKSGTFDFEKCCRIGNPARVKSVKQAGLGQNVKSQAEQLRPIHRSDVCSFYLTIRRRWCIIVRIQGVGVKVF